MTGNTDKPAPTERPGTFAPLREPPFRRIWSASVVSNFAQLFLSVGAAWEMTRMTSSPGMVALVQTAMMLPLVVVSVPAGAIADMYDKRKVAIIGLSSSTVFALMLAALAFSGLLSPWPLLAFCSLIGAGVALYSPSWQSSIPEQVSLKNLPAAIALGTVSYNVARSFGPALGGLLIVAAGAKAVFAATAVFYLPLLIAFYLWNREHVPSRLPPERLDRAILGGARYAIHSPPIRISFLRVFLFAFSMASTTALAPLVAKDLLGGNAGSYGMLLGFTGVGAVLGGLFVSNVRERFSTESTVRFLALFTGIALIVVGSSTSLALTCAAFFVTGVSNMLTIALLNVNVQLAAPRWVAARALSLYGASVTAGVAIGASVWGTLGETVGLQITYYISGTATLVTILFGFYLKLSRDDEGEKSPVQLGQEPNVALDLNLKSGPIVVEMDYDVDPDQARDFYAVMMRMQQVRKRIGGFQWSIARDVENPALWTERFHCPTWGDYLRMRDRYTQQDYVIQAEARAFDRSADGIRVRRWLEQPYGSMRGKAEGGEPRPERVEVIGV